MRSKSWIPIQIQVWAEIMIFGMIHLLLQQVFEIIRIIRGTQIPKRLTKARKLTLESKNVATYQNVLDTQRTSYYGVISTWQSSKTETLSASNSPPRNHRQHLRPGKTEWCPREAWSFHARDQISLTLSCTTQRNPARTIGLWTPIVHCHRAMNLR